MSRYLQQRPFLLGFRRSPLFRFLSSLCLMGAGLLPLAWQAEAKGAETLNVTYGQFEFPLSLESLETFAESGEVTGNLRFFARFLDEAGLAEFRRFLQQSVDISPIAVSQMTYSQLGEGSLQRLGRVLRTEANLDGFYGLRSALILAAHDPEGLSILNIIRYFPTNSIRVDARRLVALRQIFTNFVDYRDAAIGAIRQEMQTEIANNPINLSQLPIADLEQPGAYAFEKRTLMINRDRLTLQGARVERQFQVDLYLPENLDRPAPTVVVSHGLGSSPEAFGYIGEHLASHGFAVVIPQHLGSDSALRENLISGVLGTAEVRGVEFVDRPLDISYTLDQLEQMSETDATLTGRMDLQNVGAIGHSFGGYTVLALAGANLNVDRARQVCDQLPPNINTAPVLQCLIQTLPTFDYRLRDPRVQAIFAISPVTSIALGPEGLGEIEIPTFIMGGSADFVASVVLEQIHPFVWLNTPDRYLAITVPSGHTYADATDGGAPPAPNSAAYLLSGPDPALGRDYVRQLTLAFMQTYVADRPEYRNYLTSAYAEEISQPPLRLDLVQSLTADQLTAAYGRTPPSPIIPPPLVAAVPSRSQPILDEIAETGVLRVAVRQDAAPLGFVDENGQTAGFCVDAMNALANQLQQQLNTPVELDIAAISTPEDRFDLVRDNTVHVECGPNTIQPNIRNITFSTPFFVTGTHLLTTSSTTIDPFNVPADTRIGVLRGTTTETFVEERYPRADIVRFGGTEGRITGIQALTTGNIDAFAGDGILSLGTLTQLDLPRNEFNLVPERPMTCDPYGMILPANDAAWQTIVDDFVTSSPFRQVREDWFTADAYSYALFNLDFCAD